MADANSQTATFDTGKQRIGALYAKALLGAAEKAGQTDLVVEELESLVADVLNKLPKLDASLSSPRIDASAKDQMLDKAFSKKMSLTLLNFLKVVARHGRLDCLRVMAKAARHQLNELRGRIEVLLRTAAPVNNQVRDAIIARLKAMLGREVVLIPKVDPEMLGGVIVRIGDTLYDGSVATQLALMREAAVEKTAAAIRDSQTRFAVT